MKTPEPRRLSLLPACALVLVMVAMTSACDSSKSADAPAKAMDTTTDTGLVIQDQVLGEGEAATSTSAVAVHYTGWLFDESQEDNKGTQFDSSLTRNKPFEFPLGQGRVIKGWDQGVVGMKVGGKRRLIIPSELGYGARGAGRDIPPNSTLMFDIELLALDSVTIIEHKIGSGDEAQSGNRVSVDYTGWLYDQDAMSNKGKKFDSSVDRGQKFSFVLGQGNVITGWDIGVKGMKVGGKRTLIIPASMAYGARGAGKDIPPNAKLVFDVELFDVTGSAVQ
ncbi:MAG: FKBP-type peptidyl-prolyl cis-trans isomerase [Gammaproteobacteria bacterium]